MVQWRSRVGYSAQLHLKAMVLWCSLGGCGAVVIVQPSKLLCSGARWQGIMQWRNLVDYGAVVQYSKLEAA